MTPHLQFLIIIVVALVVTLPWVVLAGLRGLRHREAIMTLYIAGFGLLAGTFIVDSIVNPPLFFHGFVPGIGIGLLIGALGQGLLDIAPSRRIL